MSTYKKFGAPLLAVALIAGTAGAATAAPARPAAVVAEAAAEDHLVKDSNQQTIIDVFDGINAFRASKGLKPLKFHTGISAISQKWSDHMIAVNDFYHNPDFTSGAPGGWRGAGENIAARSDRSGQGFVQQWIASPPHNGTMSNPGYEYLGIGVSYSDGADRRYLTYSTTNFFQYGEGVVPPGTYNHPKDFFAGKPQLTPNDGVPVAKTPVAPVFNMADRTFTIPEVEGVEYLVRHNDSGWIKAPGTHEAMAGLYTFEAVAAYRYKLDGSHTWNATFPDDKPVTATAPVFNQLDGTYTIPDVTGILYFANGEAKAAGTYPGNAAEVNIWVNAVNGYALTENIGWGHDFSRVTLPNPFTRSGTYVIPKATGVSYSLDGKVIQPGTYQIPARIAVIRARASTGYEITGASVWSQDGRKAVTPVRPAMNSSTNRYTIPKRTGVTYLVDGKTVKPGTYTVRNGKTLKFTAKASASTYRLTGTTSWTFRF